MEFTKQEKKVFSKMGKKGGKIGGARTMAKYGAEHYAEIGRKGGLAKRKKLSTGQALDKAKQVCYNGSVRG